MIELLLDLCGKHNVQGYIVPSVDEYQNEYIPDYAKRLKYVTGFSGSNGIAVIHKSCNLLFTDGRYIEQAKRQLSREFLIFNQLELRQFRWSEYINGAVGYDPMLMTERTMRYFLELDTVAIPGNLVDEIWVNQPIRPSSKICVYDVKYAGIEVQDKIQMLRRFLQEKDIDWYFLSSPLSISWLLNIRSNDVPYCPIVLSYALVGENEILLFTNMSRDCSETNDLLKRGVSFVPMEQCLQVLSQYANAKIGVAINECPLGLMQIFPHAVDTEDPCRIAMSQKSETEIQNAITGHIKDGVALCEFFAWLVETCEELTEYYLGEKIIEFRQQREGYLGESFPAICGYKENSAIIHYRADQISSKVIGEGILLIDSGAHYLGSTTDVTRTIVFGDSTAEQRDWYTRVLKGHINLATAVFPSTVSGAHLDILARQFLWHHHYDYPHGTGHGVGNYLSVHEGPQSISHNNKIQLRHGMILSNEPGYYCGQYGIRIENLMYVKQDMDFLKFENLTLLPYCASLIDQSLLSMDEYQYILDYYTKIQKLIVPLLSYRARLWVEGEVSGFQGRHV